MCNFLAAVRLFQHTRLQSPVALCFHGRGFPAKDMRSNRHFLGAGEIIRDQLFAESRQMDGIRIVTGGQSMRSDLNGEWAGFALIFACRNRGGEGTVLSRVRFCHPTAVTYNLTVTANYKIAKYYIRRRGCALLGSLFVIKSDEVQCCCYIADGSASCARRCIFADAAVANCKFAVASSSAMATVHRRANACARVDDAEDSRAGSAALNGERQWR